MMKIFPLSEGQFTVDKSKQFVPFNEERDSLSERNPGSLLVEIQPFLVKTAKELLLFDTGLGFEQEGELQLIRNIRAAGFDPGDVTMVLLSHLHKDHSGGVSRESGKEKRNFALPGARYHVHTRELAFAFEKGSPSFIPAELECLKESSGTVLMEGDSGNIGESISFQVTGAHSPQHLVYWVREGGETIFFGGDDAPQLHQMKHRFVAKYDHDGKKAMQLRQQWWELGEKEKWTFLFYHDVGSPTWKFG